VEASAPQVNTTTGPLSQVVGQQQVTELPLNGRNAASLTTLVAGVVIAPNAQADQGATKTFPVAVTITANRTRVGQTNYLLDGGNNVDEYTNVNAPFPMPDALQEFSVQTSNYSAEYGQNAGGVVNIITKSGGNKYHGDLFEFVRNRMFNAANYFSYVNGVKTVDPLQRNQFGGTVGGPVSIPGLFHSDHSFFFAGYQKTIQHTSSTSATASVLPTAAQLAGNFNFTTSALPGSAAFNSACIADPTKATNPANAGQCYSYVSNGGTSYTAPNFKRLDRGPSDFDHRNVASISFVYVLPTVMKDAPGAIRYLVNNWQASGLFQTRSGDPLTVTSSANNNSGSGQLRDRAYLTGNAYGGSACPVTAHCKSWLNPASFTNNLPPVAPALTPTYGNIVKGSFVGPRYTDVDGAIARNFPIKESVVLQFRAEYFNLFNHTNFGDPTTSLGGSFDEITGTTPQNGAAANDPRIAQFSLKLLF
jgi:hypothetical protein